MVREGSTAAENELVRRFEPMHRKIGRQYSSDRPAAFDDICQAARLGTVCAVRRFVPNRGVDLEYFIARYSRGYAFNERTRRATALLATSTEYDDSEDGGADAEVDTFPSDWESPERMNIRRDVSARMNELVAASTEMDAADREIFSRRIAVAHGDRQSLREIGEVVDLGREQVRKRELRLKSEVLPRVFAELKDAV